MSEKKLIDLGAECVCGDLILGHKTVGEYRDGSFRLTDDGRKLLDNMAADEAVVLSFAEATAPAPAPAQKSRARKNTDAPAPAPAPEATDGQEQSPE